MALSRAAAAAARKAAKSRGLKGNRAEDGSMLTAAREHAFDPADSNYREIAMKMSDDELITAYKKAESDVIQLEIEQKSTGRMDETAYAEAKERLKVFEDELDARDTGEFRESNEPYDTEEEISPGFRS